MTAPSASPVVACLAAILLFVALSQAGCAPVAPAGTAPADAGLARAAPEPATPHNAHRPVAPVRGARFMVATANPHASRAAADTLRRGGSAVDAAIAAQMVLGVVEPQSSGLGGGGFLVHFDAASGAIDAWDGRETAPASASPGMFLKDDGTPMGFMDAVVGGRSVGVPGLVAMLEAVHRRQGRLDWASLFAPAIRLAEEGFAVSPRLSRLLDGDTHLRAMPNAHALFYGNEGTAPPPGTRFRNPDLARTLRLIAEGGSAAFYRGPIAKDIVAAVAGAPRNRARMTDADLAGYEAVRRDPVCAPYRVWLVCGMPAPSSGGLTTLQILGLLEGFALGDMAPLSLPAVHLFAEAGKLAYADRAAYIADPDHVAVPQAGLLDPGYLAARARLIDPQRAMGTAEAGTPPMYQGALAPDHSEPGVSTTHLSIVDSHGNAVALTSSIENVFGARLLVPGRGFLLNNQLTDFSFMPTGEDGRPVANAAAPGKRPRSSMAPTIVFDSGGTPVLVLGSPGGSRIIAYVAQAVIATLDWGLNPQAAADQPHVANRNGATELEEDTAAAALAPALRRLGHEVRSRAMTSGLHIIERRGDKLLGGADFRREGIAIGE